MRILDPGWKKSGSGINIPDPQHCSKATEFDFNADRIKLFTQMRIQT
jgi:hypothetical protein